MATKLSGGNQDFKSYLSSLEGFLDTYLVGKAPALPPGGKNFLVQFLPWITLVLLILALPVILLAFGIGSFLIPFSFLGGAGFGLLYMISIGFLVVTLVLEAMSIPGLLNKSKKGWNLLYYATLLNGVYNLLNGNIGGLLIGVLSLYLIFQIRSYYK